MESDPLFHVKQLFYQASYKACIAQAAPDQHAALADAEAVDRTLYAARAYLALSDASAALALVSSPAPQHAAARYNAVCAFAHYLANGRDEAQVEQLRDLVLEYEGGDDDDANDDEAVVRAIAGTVFILHGEIEEAVATLTEGRGKRDLECTAILVQLLLSLDRKDLAQSTYAAAKTWGDDSLLVQNMEAWIGLKSSGKGLHQSYYLYEELYQLPAGRTATVFAAHAAAHTLMRHVDEAKADIHHALETDLGTERDQVLALGITLGIDAMHEQLKHANPSHPFLAALEAKSTAFDDAAAKFAVAA